MLRLYISVRIEIQEIIECQFFG